MALDAATLALTAGELDARLTGARIDKIFQPTRDEVVLMMRSRAGGGQAAAVGPQRGRAHRHHHRKL